MKQASFIVFLACCATLSLAKLSVSIKSSGVSSTEVPVTVTVTNDGPTVYILDHRSLTGRAQNNFEVKDASGNRIPYIGPMAYFSLGAVKDNSDVFTKLASGASLSVSHDLADLYHFKSAGEYTITPKSEFQVTDSISPEIPDLAAVTGSTSTVLIKLGKAVSLPQRRSSVNVSSPLARRATIAASCSAAQSQQLTAALGSINDLTNAALAQYDTLGPNEEQFTYIFPNTATPADARTRIANLNTLSYANDGSRPPIECSNAADAGTNPDPNCGTGVGAYTYQNGYLQDPTAVQGKIYMCPPAFGQAPTTDLCNNALNLANYYEGTVGGILWHELTHYRSGTNDGLAGGTYGASLCSHLTGTNDAINTASCLQQWAAYSYRNQRCTAQINSGGLIANGGFEKLKYDTTWITSGNVQRWPFSNLRIEGVQGGAFFSANGAESSYTQTVNTVNLQTYRLQFTFVQGSNAPLILRQNGVNVAYTAVATGKTNEFSVSLVVVGTGSDSFMFAATIPTTDGNQPEYYELDAVSLNLQMTPSAANGGQRARMLRHKRSKWDGVQW